MGRSRNLVISDPQVVHVRYIVAGWLQDTVQRINTLSDDFLDFLGWVCKDSAPLLESVLKRGRKLRIKGLDKPLNDLEEDFLEGDMMSVHHKLERLCRQHPSFDKMAREEVVRVLDDIRSRPTQDTLFSRARERMVEFFNLDEHCQAICEALYIFDSYRQVDCFYNDAREFKNLRFLAYLLGMSVSDLRSAMDRLEQCGLVDIPPRRGDISLPPCAMQLWDATRFDSSRLYGQVMEGECLPLGEFNIETQLKNHAKKLMRQDDDAPVHILLYGAPGTGKTTFARSLARACRIKAWSVNSRDQGEESEHARRSALVACLNMTSVRGSEAAPSRRRANSTEGTLRISRKPVGRQDFVVVDEAERMLDTDGIYANTKDKAWLNALLERRGQRIVWITNKVEHIDPAVRRRFSLAIHFEKLGFRERCRVWQRVLKKQNATELLSQDDIRGLALRFPAEVGVISDTVAQAHRLYTDKAGFTGAVKLLLEAQDRLQHNGAARPKSKKAVSDFSLDGVCTKDNVHDLLERCTRVDAAMRGGKDIRPGCGSMLFYGAPGTGKTALARYIASMLGRECVVKRASDLVDKYVGETEKRIAAAFREAERQGALLVIDEADSFIFSRDSAVRNWESSMVNEFLTALEECRCFCVCTTNRRKDLDAAAMRRFAHKLEFDYADEKQAQTLYDKLLAPLCPTKMTQPHRDSLARLDRLAPGDFHTVCSQFDPLFVDPKTVTHEKLLAALAREQGQKLEAEAKSVARVGF